MNTRFKSLGSSFNKKLIPSGDPCLFRCVYLIQRCLPRLASCICCTKNFIKTYRIEGAQGSDHEHKMGNDSFPMPELAPTVGTDALTWD